MPESTVTQSPQEVYSSNGEQWGQNNAQTIAPDATAMDWNQLPNDNINAVPSNINPSYIPNGNVPVQYNAPTNFINIPYQRPTSTIPNGYPVPVPNSQVMPAVPVLVHTPQRVPTMPNTWATPQNIRFIQTAWNKAPSGGVKKQKRIRTAFTSHQMMELEQEYSRTRYLDRTRRIELAEMLRLNERTIKIWFQNRRMKEKKDRTENLEGVEDVTTTQSAPELSVPMLVHEQYQPNNESLNRMGVFIEQYPVSSTSMPMTPMNQQSMVPESYPSYMPDDCQAQFQQVSLQYPSPYSEVQELSPESTVKSESSVSVDNSTNDVVEKNWDLSWIRSIEAEDEC